MGVELNSSTVVEYEYDSKSRLLQRIEGGTTTNYTWNGWSLIKEVKTGTISETTDYLLPANAFQRGGDWFYMHGDALSSTQLVTDENGDQVARFIYGAWGEELYASESAPGVLENRFVGGLGCRKDAATGLIYMRHRWYDPALQRFISRDPIRLRGGTNLYQYAWNSPTRNVDALGLAPEVTRGEGSVIISSDGSVTDEEFYEVVETYDNLHYDTRKSKHLIDALEYKAANGQTGVDGVYIIQVTSRNRTETPISIGEDGKPVCPGSYINPQQQKDPNNKVTIKMPDGSLREVGTTLESGLSHEIGHGVLLTGDEMRVIKEVENPIMTDPNIGPAARPGPRIKY